MNARTALAGMRSFQRINALRGPRSTWVGPASAGRRVLYVPESNQAWDQAYAAVAAPPAYLVTRELPASRTAPTHFVFEGVGADPDHDCLWGFSHLGGPKSSA